MAPEALKRDLNEQFREKYPHVQISLSKLRHIKQDMVRLVVENTELSLSSAVLAQLYFERLTMLSHITRANREAYAGVCAILAVKFNENKDLIKDYLSTILKWVEETWGVPAKDVLDLEFTAFLQLEFSLQVGEPLIADALRRTVTALPSIDNFDEIDLRALAL